jgi:ribosomal protein S18 acetylase RimI-like enzyme
VGAVRLVLSTAHTNTAAQALYESDGWVLDRDYRTYEFALTT